MNSSIEDSKFYLMNRQTVIEGMKFGQSMLGTEYTIPIDMGYDGRRPRGCCERRHG